ncbi:MAG: hypothetical protein PHT94_04110 [Candidatus Nanoarchaeia archaeon]|nr:hypothetical protein [Candidatus Nanoarchaeia archaeon]
MKKNIMLTFLVVFAMVFQSTLVYSAAPGVAIDNVKIDGEVVASSGGETISILRGDSLEIKVKLTGVVNQLDSDAVRITAKIEGYDSKKSIEAKTELFDVKSGVSYYKTLNLEIPSDLALYDSQDNEITGYKLRVIVSDRWSSNVMESTYDIKFDSERHSLNIKDVVMSPENMVRAGNYLTLSARLSNTGTYDQKNVKVEFSIPELGLKESRYVDKIESNEQMSTDEVFIMIPECAENKAYEVSVKAYYNREEESTAAAESIVVLSSDSCGSYTDTGSKASVVTMVENVELTKGKTLTVPILIQNKDSSLKTFVVSATGAENFGAYSLDKNSAIIAGNGVGTFNLMLDADKDVAGDYALTVSFISGSEVLSKVLYVSVKAPTVEDTPVSQSKVWNIVLIGAIALLVVLIVVLLVRKFSGSNDESDEEEEKENYY